MNSFLKIGPTTKINEWFFGNIPNIDIEGEIL